MIDWISLTLNYSNSERPFSGEIISTNADHGEIYRKKKRVVVTGEHDSTISLSDVNNRIRVDGNFAKFLQGHNLFGPTDLNSLVVNTLQRLIDLNILKPTQKEYQEWLSGNYELRRVDCCLNWRLESREIVSGWLRQLPFNSKLFHKPPNVKGGTVYFGQESSHWCFKFYSKINQIAEPKYRLPTDILFKDELITWTDSILRGELVLRGRKLKHMNLHFGYLWDINTAESIAFEYLNKINISSKSDIKKLELQGLSPRLLAAFTLYTQQYNLRDFYTKSTYQRIYKDLLALGVDIKSAYSGNEFQKYNLRELISPHAIAPVPQFAIGTYLFASR
jgi:II/X family phage/plasmid replication protein